MKTLSTEHRRQLERAVVDARDAAERGARAALEALAVDGRDPFEHMSQEQRALRRRLRAHARHLGDRVDGRSGAHGIDHLTHECAYEQWHAMLFARFLAENQLLIEPEFGVAVTLEECEELAKGKGTDRWTLAARFAQRMLPQVFRPDHPVFEVRLAREHRARLEELVEGLAPEIFTASDALGWVYQFWQARKKDEVNRSEVKIGADELPAVTQLFTEPYMVQFLLHNSLGAWWESRHPDKACPADLTYLRHTEDGRPAAGTFDGWPDDLSEFRMLDPCCGSGHFLVAALLMLVPMRMAAEGLDASAAVDAVLSENLHGLEIDQRCVAIAAFALALEAWRYPGAGGYRELPRLNLAWCGQPVAGRKADWITLAEGDSKVEAGMAVLHDAFRDAPTLGSLIDPLRSVSEDMLTAGVDQLRPLLERVLERHAGDAEREETAIAAFGIAYAAELLSKDYHLVVTNVPYLTRGKQGTRLSRFCSDQYPDSKQDLATVFLRRCLEMVSPDGAVSVVMPQNWLFLKAYAALRASLLVATEWSMLVRLGPAAFSDMNWWAINTCLVTFKKPRPSPWSRFSGLDASPPRDISLKQALLKGALVRTRADNSKHNPDGVGEPTHGTEHFATTSKPNGRVRSIEQSRQLANPDARVTFEDVRGPLLAEHGMGHQGIATGDYSCFGRTFWEFPELGDEWRFQQSTVRATTHFGGREQVLHWDRKGSTLNAAKEYVYRGRGIWNREGIVVSQMGSLPVTLYGGDLFDNNSSGVGPLAGDKLAAVWCFCSSPEYREAVRRIDQKTNVTNATLVKVPFELERWRKVARERYPNGLPAPYSNDPTQWIFHGHPCRSVVWDDVAKRTIEGRVRTDATVLQVAVARLLGYRWPGEQNPEMELGVEQRECVASCDALHQFEDEDGIVCVPSVRGERPADERLLDLIRASYGDSWADDVLAKLLDQRRGSNLDDWLRNRFFHEHCKLFHHRPFIWHVWDGRKRDGFHALVNSHRLAEGSGAGRQLLESLAYSYLGDWIARQRDGVARGEGGSDDRLSAALELQKRLAAIIAGEPPFDLFVRWKPLSEQAIAWNPDLNDGVRLNIRPFLVDDIPGGMKGAGVLRSKPNIHWRKDRGKEPLRDESDFPWFWADGLFTGDRVNDVHFSNAEKRAARDEARR